MSQANEKVHQSLDGVDIKNQINIIVDQLQIQEDAREVVNGIIKEMKDTYGLPPSVIRSAACIIHKCKDVIKSYRVTSKRRPVKVCN